MSFEVNSPEEVEVTEENTNSAQNVPAENVENTSSANVTKENIIYRTYGTLDEKGQPVGAAVRRQSQDGAVWEQMEKDGKTRLCENTYIWYTLTNEEGFADLVPDMDQRLAIINKGINALQTARANQTQADFDKEAGQYVTNDQIVDLIDAINEPISKRGQSPLQKALGTLKTLNAADKAQALAAFLKMLEG
jgi:hypothetical protein